MAEVIAVEIDIKGTKEVLTLQQAIKNTNKELKETQKEIDKLEDGAEKVAKQKAFDELAADLVKYKAQLKEARREQNNVIRDLQAAETGAGSYRELDAELIKLRQSYKNLSEEQRKTAEGERLLKQIQALDKELKEIDKTLGQANRQIGFYERATTNLGKALRRAFVGRSIVEGIVALGQAFSDLVEESAETNDNAAELQNSFDRVTVLVKQFGVAVIDLVGKPLAALINSFTFIASKAIDLGTAIASFVGDLFSLGNIDFSNFSLTKFFEDLPAFIGGAFEAVKQFFSNFASSATQTFANAQLRAQRFVKQVQRTFASLTGGDTQIFDDEIQRINDSLSQTPEAARSAFEAFEEGFAAVKAEQEVFNKETQKTLERSQALENAAKQQKTAYEELQETVSSLTKQIKDNLTNGILPSAEEIEELRKKTAQLAEVQEEFEGILGKTKESVQEYANDSLAALDEQLNALEEKQKNVSIGSVEYFNIQKQIIKIESERSDALALLTQETNSFADAQQKAADSIGDSQERIQALAEAEARLKDAQTGEEVIEIRQALADRLSQIGTNALNRELENIKRRKEAILFESSLEISIAEGDAKKIEQIKRESQQQINELTLQGLQIEEQILNQSVNKFAESELKKTELAKEEAEKRKKQLQEGVQTGLQAANQVASIIGDALKIESEAELARLEEAKEQRAARIEGLTNEIQQASGLQKQFLQQQLAEEIKLQEQASKKEEQIRKDAAEKEKAIAIVQAIINTALAITSALTAGPIAGPILAAIAGAAGAVQIAAIASQKFAGGGIVEGGNGKIERAGNIPTQSNGDNILATVKTGEVILNKTQQERLGGAKTFAAIGVPGFANGGLVSSLGAPSISSITGIGTVSDFSSTLNTISKNTSRSAQRINNLQVRLNTRDLEQENKDKQVILNTVNSNA